MGRFFELEFFSKHSDYAEYVVNHRDGKTIYDKLCESPEWESDGEFLWTRGEDKFQIVVLRLDDHPDEYEDTIKNYPRLNRSEMKVWNQKPFTSIADLYYWLRHGERLDKLELNSLVWKANEGIDNNLTGE